MAAVAPAGGWLAVCGIWFSLHAGSGHGCTGTESASSLGEPLQYVGRKKRLLEKMWQSLGSGSRRKLPDQSGRSHGAVTSTNTCTPGREIDFKREKFNSF